MKNSLILIVNMFTKYICELILIICLYFSFQFQMQYHNCEKIIKSDGLGYYSYLPAIFIYNDYNFSFTENISRKYEYMKFGDDFLKETDVGKVNKYYVGFSILILPFFLIAHLLSIILGFSADGYSQFYQLSVLVAANFYLWLGCKFTRKLILTYCIPDHIAAIVLVITVFGTNLFFYSTFDVSYSHTYSFATIAAFVYFSHLFIKTEKAQYLFACAFLLGMITLLRPTNIIIAIMFIFFCGNMKRAKDILLKNKKNIFISFLIFVVSLFPQFILYYLQTGKFIVWAYGNENFYFTNPQFFKVLFGYRKGLFIYTPTVLFSLLGLFYLYLKNKFQLSVLLIFLFVSTFIIASWWCWWYGASLSQRAFVDFYVITALLISFSYLFLKKYIYRFIYFSAMLFCTYYSLVLTYQYRNIIIDCEDMNKQKFWFTFLKTDKSIEGFAYSDSLFSGIETAHIVHIKTSQNRYLSSVRDDLSHIQANIDHGLLWETFNMVFLKNENKIAFKSDDGKYISTRLDNGNILTHVANKILEWEKFEMIKLENDSFILKSCNGKFVKLNGDYISGSSDNYSEAEHFLLIKK